jgi:HEAT repeat protein
MKKFWCVLLLIGSLFSSEQEAAKRIYAHLLIHDPIAAVKEASVALKEYPSSKSVHLAYIRALAEMGNETEVLEQWSKMTSQFQDEARNRMSLEVVAWGVLNKGEHSQQMTIRLNSLLGAAFTHDVRALPLLINELRGSNAMLRTVAVKLTAMYGDGPLQTELIRMLKEEKVWYVRLEVIRAIGALRMTHLREDLKEIIGNPKTLAEEKAAAILALVSMYDSIGPGELKGMIQSNRAGLRQLACQLVAHLDLKGYISELKPLLQDSSPDVRQEAVYTLGLLNASIEFKDIEPLLQDLSPHVAITAGWLALVKNWDEGKAVLKKWLYDTHADLRWLAAAALSVTGKAGIEMAVEEVKGHYDPYVRANLAFGLIGQRREVKFACDSLYSAFFSEKNTLWMWNDQVPFRCLCPSVVSHIAQIPNYPHVVDQLTRLEILSVLSVMRHPKAQEAVKGYLKNESWGVSGTAAATLLEEGDEEALNLVRGLLDEPDQKVRVQAALILGLFGSDTAAVKVLQEAYGKVDREMKVYILEALGRIGDPESIPFLIDVLKEPFQMLRVVAASALIQSLYH